MIHISRTHATNPPTFLNGHICLCWRDRRVREYHAYMDERHRQQQCDRHFSSRLNDRFRIRIRRLDFTICSDDHCCVCSGCLHANSDCMLATTKMLGSSAVCAVTMRWDWKLRLRITLKHTFSIIVSVQSLAATGNAHSHSMLFQKKKSFSLDYWHDSLGSGLMIDRADTWAPGQLANRPKK